MVEWGADLEIDHVNRNRSDNRPENLRVVCRVGNNANRKGGAAETHCRRGHEYTPENTYIRPDTGRRVCRTCMALRKLGRVGNNRRGITTASPSRTQSKMTGTYAKMNIMQIANTHRIRTQRSLTLRQVARASGLSLGSVHAIEHGKGSPRISTLERLADGLGIGVTELLADNGEGAARGGSWGAPRSARRGAGAQGKD